MIRASQFAFSLLEMMIVILIIAIFTTLTFPIYSQHLIKKNRMQAEIVLLRISAELEKYFLQENTYLGFSSKLTCSQYRLAIHTSSAHYRLKAIPFGSQAKRDKECGVLSLTDTGEKLSSSCWL